MKWYLDYNLLDEVEKLTTSLKEKEESWRIKFEKEEGESLKREQALINGYKAEISNLKSQVGHHSYGFIVQSQYVWIS